MLALVQLGVQQDAQVLSRTTFHLDGPQHVLAPGDVPPQIQDFILHLTELYEVPVAPFLQPVESLLSGSMTL